MKRNDSVFIEDIIDCIRKIEGYLQDTSEREFESNFEKQDAVIRRIEIIGEAVKNVSRSTKESFVDIPWKEMAGMRDIVIHQYFGSSNISGEHRQIIPYQSIGHLYS